VGHILVVATLVIMAKHDTTRTDPWSLQCLRRRFTG